MPEPKRDYKKIYEELMRNAGERRRALSKRMIENERRFRVEQSRAQEEKLGRVERDLRQHARELHIKVRITRELRLLKAKLDAATDKAERARLSAEIADLRTIKSNLGFRFKRKPPESGLPVPAVPPKGPKPKTGGTAAPLDFDN